MDLKRFYDEFNPKVRHQASILVSLYRMPQAEIDDISHAGYIGISECLHKYDASRSPCVFNYCFKNMRRSMMGQVREYFGNKPKVRGQIVFLYSDSEIQSDILDMHQQNTELRVDLNAVIRKSLMRYPVQTQRFLDSIVNERSGETRAKELGVSRMALHQSVKATQKRLQKELNRG